MNFLKAANVIVAATAVSALTACGGGGGSENNSPQTGQTYAVAQAMTNLNSLAMSWSVSGTGSDGSAWIFTASSAAIATATFPVTGATALGQVQTGNGSINGTASPTSQSTQYFDPSSMLPLGSNNGDGTGDLATSANALPASATIGASGPYSVTQMLSGCTSGSASTGTETTTWSLQSDTGSTGATVVELCESITDTDTTGATTDFGMQCFETDPQGNLGHRARIVINVPGSPSFSLTMRNY